MSDSQLQPPIEFLEMRDQEVREFSPVKHVLGRTRIHNKQDPPGKDKEIHILRVWFNVEPGHPGLGYFDVSSQRLIAMLTPILTDVEKNKKKVRVQAFGSKPATQFSVQPS